MSLPGNSKWIFIVLVLVQVLLVFLNQHNFFFWDTVQFAGKHGTYFFENGLENGLLLPDKIDSGHPPLFGYILSLFWKVFGKTLVVSHWVMVPVLIGILYQAFKIGYHYFPKYDWLFPVLLFVCPFYLGHSILVSPDLLVLFGFLLALRGLLFKKISLQAIGIIIMSSISLRGAAIGVAVLIYDLHTNPAFSWKRFWVLPWVELIKKYAVGFVILFVYLVYHYFQKGWLVQHPDSSWAPSFASVGVVGMLKNLLRILWRLMDFGMIAVYVLILSKLRFLPILKDRLLWLGLSLFVILAVLTVPYVGLVNHRYFLPIQIVALVLGTQLLRAYNKRWLTVGVLIFLFLGNFWIYPQSISQGWDSTFAHQAFYKMENELYQEIQDLGIDPSDVGTAFPIRSEQKYISLDENRKSYKQFDLSKDTYILYSNVMNEFNGLSKENVFMKAEVLYSTKKRGVEMVLYKMN